MKHCKVFFQVLILEQITINIENYINKLGDKMSTLLAHIKIVEGHEEKFENISRELYEKTHSNEDSVIHYEYWRGREKVPIIPF